MGERQGHKVLAEQRAGLREGGAQGRGQAGPETLQALDRLWFTSERCGRLPSHRPD